MGEVNLKSIENLINNVKATSNPSLIANKLSYWLSGTLRSARINLYEAYLINWEEIKFRRTSYVETAWNGKVRISTCLSILNQILLAKVFDDNNAISKLKSWGLEALKLNNEQRSHYILDKYRAFLEAYDSSELLTELLSVRTNYQNLSDNEGPFHNEVFPFHFYSPEKILLEKSYESYKKVLDKEIESLIVELNIL